ncbi:MAG TPA: hypothetical protein VKI19_12280, partial [Acidimicrobiales bacterium]|nr:hypothetical protein [Acidimicrobiales bacterium]
GLAPNHAITLTPGQVNSSTDGNGQFKIQASGYSSPTCKVTVGDGTTSASTSLAGCIRCMTPYFVEPPSPAPRMAWAADKRAMGTRNGEHDT